LVGAAETSRRTQTLKNVLKYYKQCLLYKDHQLQHNALQEVSPNLRKQIYLICLLSIVQISQPKNWVPFYSGHSVEQVGMRTSVE
jgi:hypothetical protein